MDKVLRSPFRAGVSMPTKGLNPVFLSNSFLTHGAQFSESTALISQAMSVSPNMPICRGPAFSPNFIIGGLG